MSNDSKEQNKPLDTMQRISLGWKCWVWQSVGKWAGDGI